MISGEFIFSIGTKTQEAIRIRIDGKLCYCYVNCNISIFYGKKDIPEQAQQKQPQQPALKFGNIWQNLDNLFQQMSQSDVNDLNVQFMTMVVQRINSNK